MSWIRINLASMKAYMNKQSIDTFKITIIEKFDGQIDGTIKCMVPQVIHKDMLINNISKEGYVPYLTDKDKIMICSNYSVYTIDDEQFNDMITLIRAKKMVEML
jgi:hypothetical protein